jgi:hypothetical protein
MAKSPFKTLDLALASFLSMNGCGFRMTRAKDAEKAEFIFESVTDDERSSMSSLIQKYLAGASRVEPQRFLREVGSVRGQMYDFLDGKRQS